ncbi:MAG TPA: glycerophosphodiester phosphodiesterase family protein, partial [Bacteroidia bacterium]
WMNEEFCRKPNGEKIEPNSREKYNLYEMTYEEISTFDCGKNGNANFPQQKAMSVKKPLLSEVFRKIESFTRSNNLKPVVYVIEIKSEIQDDTIFQPAPDEFVNLVCKVIAEYNVMERCILQSFDVRILQELHINYSQTRIAFLVENNESLQTNLRSLGFVPPIYSPEFILANQELMTQLQQLDIQFVPWTVNEIKDMKQMIELGATGIITDYPNHAAELIRQL